MKMSNALATQFEVAEKIKLLKQIQEEKDYQAQALSEAALAQATLEKMALYTGGIKNIKRVGDAITSVGEQTDEFHESIKNEEIAHGFHFASLALYAFNFLRIPLMYLSAYILNQKVPFNMSNNTRWLYSAVLLGLTITAIAVPVTAPIIAFVMAGAGLVASTFFLGKLFYERYKLAREGRSLQRQISVAEDEMVTIQDEAKQLEHHLNEAKEEQEIIDISLEIALLEERYKAHQKNLEGLYDKQLQNKQLSKELGPKKVMFKSISLLLACATVIGLVVSLFFPPVGLGILAGVAVASATYLLGRVLVPLFQSLGKWISSKISPTHKYEALPDDKDDKDTLHKAHSLDDEEHLTHEQHKDLEQVEEETAHQHIKDDDEEMDTLHGSTSEVLLVLSEVEHLEPDHEQSHEDEPPIVTKKLFSPKAPTPTVRPSLPTSSVSPDEDEDEDDNDSEQFGRH